MLRIIALLFLVFSELSMKGSAIEPDKPIYAQSDTSKVYDIDEVVVISSPKEVFQLRQQSLSSNTINNGQLTNLGVQDLRELSGFVPNFEMPSYGSRLTSSMYVRGIGSRVNSPALGIYLDGMPIMSKAAFNFHTYQLERIDVLRGPQGTLYGQNAEGGIVRLFSRNPFYYQGTDVRLGWGTKSWRDAEFAHYHKLGEQWAMGLAGFYQGTNGYFRNPSTGQRADSGNEAGGRFRLVFHPDDKFSLDYLADYQYTRQNAFPYGLLDQVTGETAEPNTNRQGNYRRNMFHTALDVGYQAANFDFHSITSYQYLKDYMLMDQDYLPEDYMHLEQRQLQNAFAQEFSMKSRKPIGDVWHWTFGAFLSSQWLRSDAPVYFDDDFTTPVANSIQEAMYASILDAMVERMLAQGLSETAAQTAAAAAIQQAGGVSMDVALIAPGVYHTPQVNLGFYHESHLSLTPRLTATIGFRYDYTSTKIHYESSAVMSLTANVMGQQATNQLSSLLNDRAHDEFNQLLPKFALNYRLSPQGSNVYATVSKGYRAGGFNIQMFSDILQTELNAHRSDAMTGSYEVEHTDEDYANIKETISYKPETSWNFELGTHLNLFHQKLQWDIATFYMRIHDQQLSVMAGNYGYGRMMVNAGRSHSCGIETTLRGGALGGHLTWGLDYGYTHAIFDEYVDADDEGNEVSYADKHVPYIPQHTLSVQADYRMDLTSPVVRHVTFGANLSARGDTYWDEENTYSQPFYALLGAHVETDLGCVVINLWAKNLTKTRYNTFAISSGATGTTYSFAQQGDPFHCGVDIRFHF